MPWSELRRQIIITFDLEELRTLCFDLDVDYDSLRGEGKSAKVRELVALMRRRDRIPELVKALSRQRPEVSWEELVIRPHEATDFWLSWRTRVLLIGGAAIGVIIVIAVLLLSPESEQLSTSLTPGVTAALVPSSSPTIAPPPAESVLFLQLWNVEQDEIHEVIASQSFSDVTGVTLSEGAMQQIGNWIVADVNTKYGLGDSPVEVHVHMPGDLEQASPEIRAIPPVPLQLHYWLAQVGSDPGKARFPYSAQQLASLGEDFYLEIGQVGYETQELHVIWGQELDEKVQLQPRAVQLGIEAIEGAPNAIAEQLVNYLVTNPRLAIKDPTALQTLRQQMAEEEAFLAECPQCQVSIRTTLGVDLIISGRYESR